MSFETIVEVSLKKNEMIRAAFILDDPFPPDPRVRNEATTLADNGVVVDLYCLTSDDNVPLREELDGINIRRIRVPDYFRSLSALAYTFPLYHYLLKNKLKRIFDPGLYDVVHIHDIRSARAVFDLIEGYSIKSVLDLHENRPEIMKYYEHVSSGPGKVLIDPAKWKRYERKYISHADKVIVVTGAAQKYYSEQYGVPADKFVVVPNSVKRSFFEKPYIDQDIVNKYKDRFMILYLGDTGRRRGIRDVLEAVRLLKDQIPELLFVCLGNSKSDQEYRSFISEYELQDHIELAGWQDFSLFPTYITASEVCISPLHRNIHHDTTFANKLFQYMSLERPVIVSDCTAQKEVVENSECGLVYKAEDSHDMAECIQNLYNDEKLRNKFGKNGKKAILDIYNWERVSSDLVKLYKKFN